MYIIKNAWKNIIRGKGRNILIGIIITVITISACIAITINKSASNLVNNYKDSNPIEVGFRLDMMNLKDATNEEKTNFETINVDDIKNYGDSSLVKDYYYTNEISLSSDEIDPINYEEMMKTDKLNMSDDFSDKRKTNVGDFRLTGYSDASYISDFIDGDSKIKNGQMFTKDNTDKVIIISEELASENNLSVGSKIKFYYGDNTDTTYEFEIIGIYETTSDDNADSFSGMNAMTSSNQIYTNINSVSEILSNNSESNNKMNGLSAKFYLKNNDDLKSFETEVKEKGLSSYYTISTNEEDALEAVKPISNLKSFSKSFLIIILIVGSIILSIINLINIRERKYEIGVLRAIGMSKIKVTMQLVSEIFIVAIISLVLGTSVGIISSQSVANKVLKNEIESYQNKIDSINENFGGGDFKRPGFDNIQKSNNVDYVDNIVVKTDVNTVIKLLFVSVLLTTVSGFISVMFVNKYEPNKILQNRV